MKNCFMTCVLTCLISASAAQAAPIKSYFPNNHLGLFLAEKFDLATIRSSLGPRRTPALRTFADFDMKPTKATEDVLVFDMPGDWYYELRIVARRDVNKDGIEDLEVCFIDQALNGGTYRTANGLLLTRYSADGYVEALRYDVDDAACGR